MRILIRNGLIVTCDPRGREIPSGSILVKDDTIERLGPTREVEDYIGSESLIVDRELDAAGKVVLPGFVSCHNHLGYLAFRGLAEDIGKTPTPSLFLPMKQIMMKEERQAFAELATAELLRGGVTTILQMEEDGDVVAPFLEKVGIRAGLCLMANDVDIPKLLAGETSFRPDLTEFELLRAEEVISRWHRQANGRITAFVGANMALSCSRELLEGLRQVADNYSVGLTYHVGLGKYEDDFVAKLHGLRPFEFAEDVGFLQDDCIVVHCHWMFKEDIARLQRSGASVAHCPVLNCLRGSAAPVLELRERGVVVGLGIDNYFSDYFEVLRSCVSVARVREGDATVLNARESLRMATLGAAKAMKLDNEVGSLEVGKKADIQIIDVRRLGLATLTDPVATVVYHARRENVDYVFVDGVPVVEKGSLVTCDELELIDRAAACSQDAWSRFAASRGK